MARRKPIVGQRATSRRRHRSNRATVYRGAPGKPVGTVAQGPLVAEPDEAGQVCPVCGLRVRLSPNGTMRRHTVNGYQPSSARRRRDNAMACPGGEPAPIAPDDERGLPELERAEAIDQRLMTLTQLAKAHGVQPATMRRWTGEPGFPRPVAKLYAPGGPRLFGRYDVEAWIRDHHPAKGQP